MHEAARPDAAIGAVRDDASRRYALAVACCVFAVFLRALLHPWLGREAPLLPLLTAPVLAAYAGGWGPGVLATVIAGLLGVAFFVEPVGSAVPPNAVEWLRLSVFGAEGLLVSWIFDSRRRALGQLQRQNALLVQVQHDLERRERRFRETLEAAPSAMLVLDASGRVVLANAKSEDIFGYTRRELLDAGIDTLLPDGELTLELPARPAARAPGAAGAMPEGREIAGRRKDGSCFPAVVGLSPLQGDDAALTLAVVVDVSRRRSVESELRDTLESIGDGFFACDATGRLVYVNETAERLLGVSREGLVGRHYAEALPHLAGSRLELEARLAAAGGVRDFEAHFAPWGRWFHYRCFPRAAGGVSVYVEDVTDRKRTEIARRRGEELLRAVVDNAPAVIYVKDRDGRYILVNSRFRQLFGLAGDPIEGRRDEDLFPPGLAAQFRANDARVLEAGDALEVSETGPHADGTHAYLSAKFPVRSEASGDVFAIAGISTDVTPLIRAEEALRRLNAELEARVEERTRELSEANGELEAFAHTVAHDLRAPLRNLQGFAAALLEDYGDVLAGPGEDYARRMAGGAERMDRLIEDLLAYAKLARAEIALEPVDLERLVASVLQELHGDIEARRARVYVRGPLPEVRASGSVLRQVLTNLVENAIKFSPLAAEPLVEVSASRRGERVRVCIQDRGIGIDPAHLERIFDVFERLHGQEQFPGTGIGLAIVRKGIERMGGAVGVESAPGAGSTFWIELPAP